MRGWTACKWGQLGGRVEGLGRVPPAFSLINTHLHLPAYFTSPPAISCCPESLKLNTWTPWMLSTEPDWQALATPPLPVSWEFLGWLFVWGGMSVIRGVAVCCAPSQLSQKA